MPISQEKRQKEMKTKTEKAVDQKQLDREVAEQILLEAKIVARWAKKPFYIS